MADEVKNGEDGAPPEAQSVESAGGLGGPYADHDRRTATLLCRATRWPITKNDRELVVRKLKDALAMATKPRDIASLTKVLAQVESQNQADDHLADKNARLDSGQVTERIDHKDFNLSFDKMG